MQRTSSHLAEGQAMERALSRCGELMQAEVCRLRLVHFREQERLSMQAEDNYGSLMREAAALKKHYDEAMRERDGAIELVRSENATLRKRLKLIHDQYRRSSRALEAGQPSISPMGDSASAAAPPPLPLSTAFAAPPTPASRATCGAVDSVATRENAPCIALNAPRSAASKVSTSASSRGRKRSGVASPASNKVPRSSSGKAPTGSGTVEPAPLNGTRSSASTGSRHHGKLAPPGEAPKKKQGHTWLERRAPHTPPTPGKKQSQEHESGRGELKKRGRLASTRLGVPKDGERSFAFREVVRKKKERARLPGQVCEKCRSYYEMLINQGIISTEEAMRVISNCSRHKDNYPLDLTPEGFWELSFADSIEERKKQGEVGRGGSLSTCEGGPS
uniref:DNA endonuclease activator Ctp1 C-terminal domain-containing protein n=1 Tax=Rhizochromulina marina TaxID=1034831 RepID=A0A7S2WI60_9STRA|mmetsp:Transcript_24278/g.71297  ORF Transcript_24278/g.71297 Transcript_24278/m.71297 type:complete len:390 (+) Transcript_24278:190-1359(+)